MGDVVVTRGLRPVRTRTRDDAVLDELAAFVAAAGLGQGDRLPAERELSTRLQVGRSTIREALKRWQALGMVEMRKGAGTFLLAPVDPTAVHVALVLRLKRDGLLRTLEVRRALEGEAAALAARRASTAAIEEIRDRLERMEAIHSRYGEAPAEDWEFHLAIYRATDNPIFQQLISILFDAFHDFFTNPLQQPGFASRSFPFHREMFDAIAARDPDRARAKALSILDIVEEDVRAAHGG